MKQENEIKVLWLSPNLNHYKARLLSHLGSDSGIDLYVFFGSGQNNKSKSDSDNYWNFKQISVDVNKRNFGKSKLVKEKFASIFNEFDWIMIPVEKKNIWLFLFAKKLQRLNKKVRLFSYNHPVLKSGKGEVTFIDKWMTKFYFKRLDRVIFYTQYSCEWAIKKGFVNQDKAYWANNTIDNTEIQKHYNYQLPPDNLNVMVYIGRLTPRKGIPDLLKYYNELKKGITDLRLEIIGDGPENHHVKSAIESDSNVIWHGTLIEEKNIAPIMTKASFVFIPGHSGLSVSHAFSYGRPYVTLKGPSHAPELDYLENGTNGYLLQGDFESNTNTIANLLTNRSVLERFCNKAKQKGEYLSVQNWVNQIKRSLFDG